MWHPSGVDTAHEKRIAPKPVTVTGGGHIEGIYRMLWTILLVLLVLWLLGFLGSVGGSLIHILLVIALVVLVAQLLTGRRAV